MINSKLTFERFCYDAIKKCHIHYSANNKKKCVEYETSYNLLIRIYLRNDTISIFISSKNKKRDLMFFKSLEYEENYIDKINEHVNTLLKVIKDLPICCECGEKMIPKVVKLKTIWDCSHCKEKQSKPTIKSIKDLIKN